MAWTKWMLVTIFVMMSINCINGKKKTDYSKHVQKIDNIKDFKKVLRTRTNVLVLFGSSESSMKSVMNVFGEAAIASKGTATLVQVDCSTKEGKKLCKKQKAKPDPTVIQHYKDGEYSADYDRKFSVKSILAFLRDPSSDGPWEEEDSAQDVVHLHSENELNKLLKKKKPTLIMFYAPWCGYCKRFKPAFAEAATELKNKVVLAGVDADNPEAASLRQSYNITGFPKTIYFENGKVKFDYSGGHKKEDVIDWLADPQPEKEKEPEKGWDESENDVVHLTDDTFDDFIASNSKVMVFFYAPWCGHCKNMKPHWETAAATLKEEEAPEKLTALDATKFGELATKYKVKGYPTIIYFEDGVEKFDASGAFTRTAEGIVEYIKNPTEPPPPEKEWHETESDVQHLTDEDFKSATKKKKHSLIMFYAPWCGHCKKAKPEYMNSAATFADDKKVMFGAIDCTQHKKSCDTFSVKGYPTFYYLSYGKSEVKYQGGREAPHFSSFMEDIIENSPDDNGFWEEVPGSELLHHQTNITWENFVSDNSLVLMVIYDEACTNCQALREPLGEIANTLEKKAIEAKIGVYGVDILDNEVRNLWHGIDSVPSIFWFKNGRKEVEYEGARSARDLMKFINQELRVLGPEWSTLDSAENIHHLDNDERFEEFLRAHDEVLVFFYSPTCQTCDTIKPKYEEASTLLDELKPEVSLAAANIRKVSEIKVKYEITSLPTFFYFVNGKMKFQYHGKPTAEAFVDFMIKPEFIPKPITESEDGWFDEDAQVLDLNKESLPEFIKQHEKALVMFYAPWCGHCKKFKSAFAKAGDALVEKGSTAKLGAFNGDNNHKVNSEYDVQSFPTLVYFEDHKYVSHYDGEHTTEAVVDFIMSSDVSIEKSLEEGDVIGESKPDEVEELTPETFQSFIESKENVLVMFYAPWCGTCKTVSTSYFEAAIDISEDMDDASMGIFNAHEYKELADEFEVKSYPTILYFHFGEKKYKYNGELTKEAFVDFMSEPQEIEEEESTKDSSQWITQNDGVYHLHRDNFENSLMKHDDAMVFFYINACQYCLDSIKPRYVEAAKLLATEKPGAFLAAINGDWEKPVVSKYKVHAFPTLLYFKKGNMQYKYEGPNDAASLVKFLKSPSKDLAKRRKPVSWQDLPNMSFGRVEHLSNSTYNSFLEKHDTAMIMFHSAWYQRCLEPREAFSHASEGLPTEIGMGAVDCHRKPEQGIICYELSVKKFPSFKYYKNGNYQQEFDGSTTEDILNFFKKEKSSSIRDEL